jgi:hypothetical protein
VVGVVGVVESVVLGPFSQPASDNVVTGRAAITAPEVRNRRKRVMNA